MIEFIDVKTNKKIDMFFKIKLNTTFAPEEEIIIEGVYYKFIKKSTLFYRDLDGEKMATCIYVERQISKIS